MRFDHSTHARVGYPPLICEPKNVHGEETDGAPVASSESRYHELVADKDEAQADSQRKLTRRS